MYFYILLIQDTIIVKLKKYEWNRRGEPGGPKIDLNLEINQFNQKYYKVQGILDSIGLLQKFRKHNNRSLINSI